MYFILLLYLLFLYFYYDVLGKKGYQKLNLYLSCMLLILVAGFRYRIGVDTIKYMEDFKYYPTLDKLNLSLLDVEPFWLLINSVCKTLYDDFVLVQLVQAAIVNIIIFWFIKRHSPKPFLAILLYYVFQWWNFCFEVMRESISIAFYLYALDAILAQNNWKKYYLRIWPALLVHTFGFVTLLFPFIQLLKFRKSTLGIFAILIVLAFTSSTQLNTIIFLFDGSIADKVNYYLDSNIYGGSSISIMGILAYFLGNVLPILIILYIFYKYRQIERISRIVPYLLIFLLIIILRIQVTIFYRFFNYFEIIVIVAMTQLVSLSSLRQNRNFRYLTLFALILMSSFKIYQFYKPAVDYNKNAKIYHRYYPYNSVFNKEYHQETEWIFRQKR